MFALVHQMRTRLIASPSFTGARILAAILFENTMDRDIAGAAERGLSVACETGGAVLKWTRAWPRKKTGCS